MKREFIFRDRTPSKGVLAVVGRFAAPLGRAALLPVAALLLLPACDPTPAPPEGPAARPAASGTPPSGCAWSASQPKVGLRMDCRISGPLPDRLIDPADPSNSRCELASFSLSGQRINVPISLVYGVDGDETNDVVGLSATLRRATHSGRLAKSIGTNCENSLPPVTLDTRFSGEHRARIDKTPAQACVFESRLGLNSFKQTSTAGVSLDTSGLTRDMVHEMLERRLDLELAKAVNRLVKPGANTDAAGFVRRSGRCADGYRRASGD